MMAELTGTFTGTGTSSATGIQGYYNVSLAGVTAATATVQLQRSFDNGTTWLVVESYTADAEQVKHNPEFGVQYRYECTAHTSGTVTYRLSN